MGETSLPELWGFPALFLFLLGPKVYTGPVLYSSFPTQAGMCFLRGVFVSIGLPPLDVVVGLPLGCVVTMGSPPLDVVVGRPPCGLGSVGSILLRFEGQGWPSGRSVLL